LPVTFLSFHGTSGFSVHEVSATMPTAGGFGEIFSLPTSALLRALEVPSTLLPPIETLYLSLRFIFSLSLLTLFLPLSIQQGMYASRRSHDDFAGRKRLSLSSEAY
jgi:hypothetical protein